MRLLAAARDTALLLAALGVALWYAQAHVEKNLIEKSRLLAQAQELHQRLQACEGKAAPVPMPGR